MKRLSIRFLILMSLCSSVSFALSWNDVFYIYFSVMTVEGCGVALSKQAVSFLKEKSFPTIAASDIKAIRINSTCKKPLVDIGHNVHNRIEMMDNPETIFQSSDHNSGTPSASLVRDSLYDKLCRMVEELDWLATIFNYRKNQFTIKVFEGLRDLETQKELFDNKVIEIKKEHPDWTPEQCEQEACTWVSPVKDSIPAHSTGAAVDIRLWDNEKPEFLDMGPFGVIWGDNPTAPTFSEDLTDQQKINRLFMLIAADRAGLVNYPYEWWHFSSDDCYAAYWTKDDPAKRISCYGPCNRDSLVVPAVTE